ncbi:IS3 family transposase [Candidimonas nitroreducens]|uniref:IS3 family transposase n=1 Tax=Candidimonas nitroreducens TaxID=683354 RepID=A0A225LVF6_9BURK|nr:IS3 family transposase [Candidimonas nitroreducens]
MPVREVAIAMGVGDTAVRRWVQQYKSANGLPRPSGPLTAEQLRIRELEIENRQLREDNDIPKKSVGLLCTNPQIGFGVVKHLQTKAIAVLRACRLLGVSRSGYYKSRRAPGRSVRDVREEVYVRAAFSASHETYGSRRIVRAVRSQGLSIGRYRVRKLMKRAQLTPRWRRRFVTTPNSHPNVRVGDNLLDRQFSVQHPNQTWVTDITHVVTGRGWLYLAAVLDLYSRKVVGWATATTLSSSVVIQALDRAMAQRHPPRGLIVHSDRGSQFTGGAYQHYLHRYGIRCSMSRAGNCWDNAVMERFFLSLKREWLWPQRYANQSEAAKDIARYIHLFYNPVRIHSTLGYLAPDAYEQVEAQKTRFKLSTKT